ncbi:MAG: magnesium transporter [Methanosarcinales archaeon]|jgi:mgtE-like transporter|nr:magnesium transporter [Methanosarcinales archaeon]
MSYYTVKGLVKGGLPVLIVTCFMAIIVGLLLGYQENILIEYPTLLILMPVLLKIGGDTGSMLGSRLSSAFHLGLGQRIFNNPVIRNSLIAAIIVAVISSAFVSTIVYFVNLILGYGTSAFLIFGVNFIVVLLDIIIVYTIAVGLSSLSHRSGLDPDDVVIPTVASMGDLVGVIGIMAAIIVFGLTVI